MCPCVGAAWRSVCALSVLYCDEASAPVHISSHQAHISHCNTCAARAPVCVRVRSLLQPHLRLPASTKPPHGSPGPR